MAKLVFDFNRTLYDPEKRTFFSGVFPMIKRLSKTNQLFLISLNEPGREDFFNSSPISKFFVEAEFTERKTLNLVRKMVSDDKNSIIIGDRITEEIRIGNLLGIKTIRVLQGKFANELPTSKLGFPTFTINKISELESLLEKI